MAYLKGYMVPNLGELKDTYIPGTPSSNQLLGYNGSDWTNMSTDSRPSLNSDMPLKNSAVAGLVGVVLTEDKLTGDTSVSFTSDYINYFSECRLLSENNSNTAISWKTATMSASVQGEDIDTITYTFDPLPIATTFYLKVINEHYYES